MSAQAGIDPVNEVRLVGRVSTDPVERILPSGDALWSFRLIIDRESEDPGAKRRVDVLDCAVWGGRVRRSVATWQPGDQVEVAGAIRRRFFQTPGGAASRVEIEVSTGRVIRRAVTA